MLRAWVGWPMLVGTLDGICVVNGLLPAGYLLEMGMKVTFFICWMYVLRLVWRGDRVSQNAGNTTHP